MMPSPEEMSAWTADEITAEIQVMLPKGWTLDLASHPDGYYVATLVDVGQGVQLSESHPDQRLGLLNVYGWLWARGRLASPNALWVRRRELSVAAVTRAAMNVPDPQDLDPAEVAAVYRKR